MGRLPLNSRNAQDSANSSSTHQLTRAQRQNQFTWGLLLGLVLLLLGLLLTMGTDFFGSAVLAFSLTTTYIPTGGLVAVAALVAIKATRWFGIGLLVGVVLYIVFDAALIILFLRYI